MINQTRRQHIVVLGALAGSLGLTPSAFAVTAKDYFGVWTGTLNTGSLKIPKVDYKLVIHSETAASLFVASQVPDEWRASRVAITPEGIELEFSDLEENFKGSLIDANTLRVTTTWKDAPPLDLKRGDAFALPALSRKVLADARQASGSPAMAAAFARNGAKATVLADGVRSIDAKLPVEASDKWVLNSITKSMTATLVARLVEAGRCTWDTTVEEILGPSLPDIRDVYKPATFRHLLSHHAGFPEELDEANRKTFSSLPVADPRPERLRYAGLILKQPQIADLGKKWNYTANGYIVAAAMLESVCKHSWEELIRDHVFVPLKLRSAGLGQPVSVGKLDQPVGHYRSSDGKFVPYVAGRDEATLNPVARAPSGEAYMSLTDLVAYLNAHLLQPASFLRPATWKTLHTPPFVGAYAMGWFVRGDGRLFHGGLTARWYAEVIIDPRARTVAAAAANASSVEVNLSVDRVLESAMLRAAR